MPRPRLRRSGWFALALVLCAADALAEDPSATPTPPRFELPAEKVWQLDPPGGERFDASGLLLRPNGELWTVSDRGAKLYRIRFRRDRGEAGLVEVRGLFTKRQLARFAQEKVDRYDCEGIAEDPQGRIYLCEEANRWLLRFDPTTKTVARLNIDWSPVAQFFHPTDRNASFEGVAVGGGRIYVANERQQGRIIAVDAGTLRVVDDFVVRPSNSGARDIHYSDLCWFDGSLFVLLRENRCILEVEPGGHRVLAEFSYADAERSAGLSDPLTGKSGMEGLAVGRDQFWLVADNQGRPLGRQADRPRPVLLRLARPKTP